MQSLNKNWFYIFSGQANQTRQSSQTQNRLCVSEICRTLLTELIPIERLTVIIKIIHFLMRLGPIEMPKQSIEIHVCKLINLLSNNLVNTLHLLGAEKTIRE